MANANINYNLDDNNTFLDIPEPHNGCFYPEKENIEKCMRGIGCDYGICDDCIMTMGTYQE